MPHINNIELPSNDTYGIQAVAIPYGECDSTSTSTAFTATVPGITELTDGTVMLLKNGVVTSESGFTININGLGAKPSYTNLAASTRDTTLFNVNYTMMFVYDSTRVSGGCWICYRGYDANTNTIGYQIRTNGMSLPMKSITYRYRLLFTAADGKHFVPANNSTSTNATATRTVCQDKIDPFGMIVYYGTTASVAAGSRPSASYLWQQYVITLGYSFNKTGAALVLTPWNPVYIKCAPQTDGSAIIDQYEPYVQSLPSSDDGNIYIYLGIATAATTVELHLNHPVYYFKDGAIRIWTNPITSSASGTVTSVGISNSTDGGLTVSGSPVTSSGSISIGHSNVLNDAQTTQGVYPITIDKNGHVASYGAKEDLYKVFTLDTDNFSYSDLRNPGSAIYSDTDMINAIDAAYDTGKIAVMFSSPLSNGGRTYTFYAIGTGTRFNFILDPDVPVILTRVMRFAIAGCYVQSENDAILPPLVLGTLLIAPATNTLLGKALMLIETDLADKIVYSVNPDSSLSSSTLNDGTLSIHHNSNITAVSTQGIYPVTIDEYGHITSAGSAVTPLTTDGGTINGDLALLAPAASDSKSLIFQRGTLTDNYNDWRIQDRSGFLYFDQRGNGSVSWSNQVVMNTSGNITATSFTGSGAGLTNLNYSNISTNAPTAMTSSEATTGTATTARLITAAVLREAISNYLSTNYENGNTSSY